MTTKLGFQGLEKWYDSMIMTQNAGLINHCLGDEVAVRSSSRKAAPVISSGYDSKGVEQDTHFDHDEDFDEDFDNERYVEDIALEEPLYGDNATGNSLPMSIYDNVDASSVKLAFIGLFGEDGVNSNTSVL